MLLPKARMISYETCCHSELSNEPDSELFEGSELEPELEESEESKEEGALEVVM